MEAPRGNCWFLSAAATLATRPELFSQVVSPTQSFAAGYTGKFCFRFWRYGTWVDVEIDDRLPSRNGSLYFSSNRQETGEFWCPLLEKAFAKLFGSYQALDMGYSDEALVDFTGGLGESVDLNDPELEAHQLFKRLKRLHRNGALLCSTIAAETSTYESQRDNGLVVGHAYSITGVVEVEIEGEESKILRLRNPWGYREWNGAWSDSSEEWRAVSEEQKEALDLIVRDEGEFWMPVTDFVAGFDSLQICHLTPDSVRTVRTSTDWTVQTFHGAWVRGVSAGGCGAPPNEALYRMNPQYYVRLQDADDDDDDAKCTMVVSLMQKYARAARTRLQRDDTRETIGFDIQRYLGDVTDSIENLHAPQSMLREVHKMYRYENLRERTAYFRLDPGLYCVVPCLYDPHVEGHFMLRIGTEKPAEAGDTDVPSGPMPESRESGGGEQRKFDRMFAEHVGDDAVVDWRELQHILNEGLVEDWLGVDTFSRETCRALIKMATGDRNSRLTKRDCKTIWRKVIEFQEAFSQFDADGSGQIGRGDLRNAFTALGMSLSRRALVSMVERYCGNSDSLSLDEFIMCAAKVSATSDVLRTSRRDRPRAGGNVELSYDDMLDLAL